MLIFNIENITALDIPVLAEIEREESMLCGWSENSLLSELKKENAIMLKATDGGVICGFITAEKVLDEVNINNVAVNAQFRRNGVATALLKELEAQTPDVKFYLLEVRESNAPAISLYTSLGFEIAGKRKNFYYNPPEDALIMIKGYW
ncbi:MAG: ribosomal protein S18-alanine N-acetyltransferase [Oscillospiraceae bacterium]|nr:ribosomal protein S18-alanine N-acetyltransferase [Oscillospiraceae bacterium]